MPYCSNGAFFIQESGAEYDAVHQAGAARRPQAFLDARHAA
jgi:hypothetical protein